MTGLKIKCLSCSGIYHETTEAFDPLQPLNGTMFILLPEYGPKGHNWSSFPCDVSIRDADLVCPNCETSYVGGIRIVMESGRSLSVHEARQARLLEEEKKGKKEQGPWDSVRWNDLRKIAVSHGLYKNGMKKQEVIEKLMELQQREEKAKTQRAEGSQSE